MLLRERAWELVCEFVQDKGLRRHILSVGAAMRWYAGELGYDVDFWEAAGLLHDFDWEIHPNLNEHPMQGAPILRARGWDEEIIRVILSHYAEGTGVLPTKAVDFALLACDEITGLILATALVRPNRNLLEVALPSVQKKWKNRQFAAGVDRDSVVKATEDFSRIAFAGQLDLWTHVANVLTAMQTLAAELGLDGSPAQPEG